MSAELARDDLVIRRSFDAPASLIFSLWAEPEHMRRWMGPGGFDCPKAEIDFRVGGAYRVTIRSTEHGEDSFGGVYREIEQDRRLVFTFTWYNNGPSAGVEMLVTVTFEEQNGRTVQTFHQTQFLNAERRDAHARGWPTVFDKQEAYVQRLTQEHAA
jgi:uncharacterized protein YndB with AHSA1/START domain